MKFAKWPRIFAEALLAYDEYHKNMEIFMREVNLFMYLRYKHVPSNISSVFCVLLESGEEPVLQKSVPGSEEFFIRHSRPSASGILIFVDKKCKTHKSTVLSIFV